MKYLLTTIVLLLISDVFCQNREYEEGDPMFTPSIIPATPTASELGRYGQAPINLSTGTLNLDIPLFTYWTRNISVPITLTYSCNGIKVDQISSWVGLGWTLIAGGVITRTIRDGADDINDHPLPPDNLFLGTPQVQDFLTMITDDENCDTEPDLFTFYFNGFNGEFVFDQGFEAVLIPFQNIKIENDYYEHPTDGIKKFIITTPDGIKYYFGGDSCVETSRSLLTAPCGKSINPPYITSWYLKKILHPLGDSICFQYSANQYNYQTGTTQSFQKELMTQNGCPGYVCSGMGLRTCIQSLNVKALHLVEISSPGLGKIEFESIRDRVDIDGLNNLDSRLIGINVYDYDDNLVKSYDFIQHYTNANSGHRLFLDSLKIWNSNESEDQKYCFQYHKDINSLPERLSYAQDHWGFFNGENNNQYLIPHLEDLEDVFGNIGGEREPNSDYADIGLLTRIIYPTGGHDSIEYEANTYNDDVWVYPDPIQIYNDTTYPEGDYTGPVNKYSEDLLIPFNQTGVIKGGFSYEGENPDHAQALVYLYDKTDDENIFSLTLNNNNHVIDNIEVQLVENHIYQMITELLCDKESVNFILSYINEDPTLVNMNIETGGNRVKRVLTYDVLNENPEIVRYYYANSSDLNKSSGHINNNPVYYSQQTIEYGCSILPGGTYPCQYGLLHSSSLNNLYEYGKSIITYSNVIVSYGEDFDNGGEEHSFFVSADCPGINIHGNSIAGTTYNNTGWDNGKELSKRTFRKDDSGNLTTVSKIINRYKIDERKEIELKGVVANKIWTPIVTHSDTIFCNEETCDDYELLPLLGDNIFHHKYDTLWSWCRDICYLDTLIYPVDLDNYDVMEYSIYSKWQYLDSVITYQFDQDGENPIQKITCYFYDNPEHANLSRSFTINSKGDTLKTFYYYPGDYNDSAIFTELLDRNITGVPIDTRNYINDALTSGKVVRYNNLGQPVEVYIAEDELGSSMEFDSVHPYSYGNTKIKYLYSNSNGNLVTLKRDNEILTSYEWGYKSQFPISESQNAAFSEVSSTSFEDDSISGFKYAEQVILDDSAHTGIKVALVSTINGTQYGPGKDIPLDSISDPSSGFQASVWVKSTSTNPYLHIEIKDVWSTHDRANCSGSGKWELLQVTIPQDVIEQYSSGNNQIRAYVGNNSGTAAYFDDIRVHPSDALMKTYTYDPMVGITSASDPGNLPIYYQYDAFGRLQYIRDNNYQILSEYNYHFTNGQ